MLIVLVVVVSNDEETGRRVSYADGLVGGAWFLKVDAGCRDT